MPIIRHVKLLDADCLYDSGGAQRCNVTVNVRPTGGPQRIRVDRTGDDVVCIQCFNASNTTTYGASSGMLSASNTTTSGASSGMLNDSNTTTSGASSGEEIHPGQQVRNIGENVNGVLVLDPGVLGDGRDGEFGPIACNSSITIPDLTFYSSGECEQQSISAK